MSWIQTYTGRRFPLDDVRAEHVDLRDVAHALSNQCRYAGHCRAFYSVAEHCVLLCEALLRDGHDRLCCLAGLLHDASEAYVVDVPRPLKGMLRDYGAIEERVQKAVAERFGLPYPWPDVVTEYDHRMLVDEKHSLMSHEAVLEWETDSLRALGVEPLCLSPSMAKWEFTKRFNLLVN